MRANYCNEVVLRTSPKEVVFDFIHKVGDGDSSDTVRLVMTHQTFGELRAMLADFGKEKPQGEPKKSKK